MFNLELINAADLRKWIRFVLSCGITAFVTFWGSYAAAGWECLRAGLTPEVAKTWALFSGAGAMAAATLASARANELWKELTVILPKNPTGSATPSAGSPPAPAPGPSTGSPARHAGEGPPELTG